MANLNLNKVVLAGKLVADPELKQTASGIAVVSFRLAVNRRYQSKAADRRQTSSTSLRGDRPRSSSPATSTKARPFA